VGRGGELMAVIPEKGPDPQTCGGLRGNYLAVTRMGMMVGGSASCPGVSF